MSISTGTGDRGESGLIGGSRVSKDDIRLQAYGTVDELNSMIGVARTLQPPEPLDQELADISSWLFCLGSDLATPGAGVSEDVKLYQPLAATKSLEEWIHREEKDLPPLRRFILPGGSSLAAHLHLARTICRRAERHVVSLTRRGGEGVLAVVFLNRLGDLLFLYARRANLAAGIADIEWQP